MDQLVGLVTDPEDRDGLLKFNPSRYAFLWHLSTYKAETKSPGYLSTNCAGVLAMLQVNNDHYDIWSLSRKSNVYGQNQQQTTTHHLQ